MFVGLLKNDKSSLTWHLVCKHLIVLVREAFISLAVSRTILSSSPSPIGCDPYEMIQSWTVGFWFSLFPYGILKEYGIQLIFEPQWRLAVWFSFQHNISWILYLLNYAAVCAFLQVLQPLQKQSRNSLSSKQNAFFLRRCFTVQVSGAGGDKGSPAWYCGWWCWYWVVMLALGAAFRLAQEEMFGQEFHTALQSVCNSLEKFWFLFEQSRGSYKYPGIC